MAPPSSPPLFSTSGILTLPSKHWHPLTTIVQVEEVPFTIVAEDLHSFPIIPSYCQLISPPPTTPHTPPNDPSSPPPSIKLRIVDQGRDFGRQGKLGRGTKMDYQSAPAPPGSLLTYFVCVARGPLCDDATLLSLYALLQTHGIGSMQYEAITTDSEILVYDIARSPGYALNSGTYVRENVSFRPNVSWSPPTDPSDFLVWVVSRYTLQPRTHLWVSYGSGSSHHAAIRAARNRARDNLPVGPTAQRKAQKHRCDAARRAKAQKLADSRDIPHSRPSRSSTSSVP
jgi:hypothetical protein